MKLNRNTAVSLTTNITWHVSTPHANSFNRLLSPAVAQACRDRAVLCYTDVQTTAIIVREFIHALNNSRLHYVREISLTVATHDTAKLLQHCLNNYE